MIIDCFPFARELDVLELRLATLYPIVDHFILAESPTTFAGHPKQLFYLDNMKRYELWNDKIRHVLVDDMPSGKGIEAECAREAHQKAAIGRGLPPDLKSSDIIIMGDCDEIPRPEIVLNYKPSDGLIGLEWRSFLFFLNLEFESQQPNWIKLCGADELKSKSLWDIRCFDSKNYGKILPNAGWHFTFMGGAVEIAEKAAAAAGTETIPDYWKDPVVVQDALNNLDNEKSKNPIRNYKKLTIRQREDDWPEPLNQNWDSYIRRGLIYDSKTVIR